MESKQKYFDDLTIIKKIMEESSRFLSLSGLSGLFAGLIALTGGAFAFFIILQSSLSTDNEYFKNLSAGEMDSIKIRLIADAILVLIFAIGVSLYFSYRKSLRLGTKIWTPLSRRLLLSLLLPLVTGGIFIIILYVESQWQLIIPSMLIFYGLALVNAGKFTYSEVFYLGLIEIITGLASALLPEYRPAILVLRIRDSSYWLWFLYVQKIRRMKVSISRLNKLFENRVRLGIMSVLMLMIHWISLV